MSETPNEDPTPDTQAMSMADAWGFVVVSNFQAAAMFDKLAEMIRDSSPEMAHELQVGAEALRSA